MRNSSSPTVVNLRVRVTPRGGRDAVLGVRSSDGVLLLRVAAPPVEGAANRACIELVAKAFGVKRAQVEIVGGETSRDKRFQITGITEAERESRFAALPIVGDDKISER